MQTASGDMVERHQSEALYGADVCWATRRVALHRRVGKLEIADLDTGSILGKASPRSPWRSIDADSCGDADCDWHVRLALTDEQAARVGAPEYSFAAKHCGSRVVLLENDAEVRLVQLEPLGRGELVIRARGRQFSMLERRGGAGWVDSTADGRLLAGVIVRWTRKDELSPEDEQYVEHALRLNGVPVDELTEPEFERVRESFESFYRFQMAGRFRFMVDVERREVVVEPGDRYLYFAPTRLD